MWKESTGRKVLLPVVRKWGLLPWSAVPLLISIVAAVFGFRDTSPSGIGLARLIAVFFAGVFVVVVGAGVYVNRSST